ncbi:hypothetical protein EUGRSUZ_J00698 [Eucalyptus grandis]|uniref:Uncharacterized protein n=2 Tax=Eucalyptus grandis TaxID=71139 RepID=A0ACC3J2V2_EUCGR|nr:hypothetical protein EUGRSUZ_J00698 [Eucalyptus grandis]
MVEKIPNGNSSWKQQEQNLCNQGLLREFLPSAGPLLRVQNVCSFSILLWLCINCVASKTSWLLITARGGDHGKAWSLSTQGTIDSRVGVEVWPRTQQCHDREGGLHRDSFSSLSLLS